MTKFALLATVSMLVATPAFAQTTTVPAAPETPSPTASSGDIVVTAAKRSQSLHDVPLSVAVTSEETIERAQIVDLIDLQSVVPSLKVNQSQSTAQTGFIIRGFGNGTGNIGVESSVGVFIDGVYRSRSASAIQDLPELERVEVLRGPQSTLFGKNVSAGAISITTKLPQFEWGGRAELSAGNYGMMRANASITGPITSTLAFRIYGSIDERDGYFRNAVLGNDVNGRNRQAIRGDLLFVPSSDFSIRVIADYNRIDERCCGAATIFNGPSTMIIGAAAPTGLGLPIGSPEQIFAQTVYYDQNPDNRLTGKGISGEVNWNLGFAKLTSISAYRTQTAATSLDVDFTGAALTTQTTADKIKTFTQELRLASPGHGKLNWLVGAFYFHENIDTERRILFGRDLRGLFDRLSGGAIRQLETLQSLVDPAIVPGRTYFQAGQGIDDAYTLKDESFSLFGQADYKLTGRITLTGGVAYLHDRKQAASFVTLGDPFSALNVGNVPALGLLPLQLLNPAAPAGARIPTNLFAGLKALQFFTPPVNYPNASENGILTGDDVTYAARASYDLGRTLKLYASYSTGWKAGAYNLSSDSRPPNVAGVGRTARPERVGVLEIGAKASFRGGYLNVALFDQVIRDFQSNAFVGSGFQLVNAGKESVRGVEVEGAYRVFRALQINAAATYLDPKYDSFTGAPCVVSDVTRCGAGQLFRDLSGQKPGGIATFSSSVAATYSLDFGGGYSAFLRGEYDHTSRFAIADTVPAAIASNKVDSVNASLGLSTPARLEVQLWVRNLTKDKHLIGAFPTVVQPGSFSGYPNEPRTYGITLRKSF